MLIEFGGTVLIKIKKIERILANMSGFFAVIALFTMMLLTAIDVMSRSAFNFPLTGVFEISETSMVIIVYLGLLWAQYDKKHIRVSLISDKCSEAAKEKWEGLAWFFATVFLMILAVPTIEGAYDSFVDKEFRWGVFQMPIWWVKIIAAAGLSLAVLQMILHTIHSIFHSRVRING